METYQHRGRFYVLGSVGERYSLRVKNPTNKRVEALLSVDGLDVIDGKPADFVNKRGYVVPAYGELKVDGFRVSTSHVATFRFSSVKNSYAGRKGKARNVGVVGVAIFAEKPQPQVIMPAPVEERRRHVHWDAPDYDLRGDGAADESAGRAPSGKKAGRAEAEAPAEPASGGSVGGESTASRDSYKPTRARDSYPTTKSKPPCCGARPKDRPGLGTEFGERRYSAVSYTRFERAHPSKPTAIAEFRYNDRQGLLALGIRLPALVNPDELSTRETADPFPGSNGGFASPPMGWR